MPFTQEHDLHRRRWTRNLGLGLTLAAFMALVFGLTIVKVQQGSRLQGFDHTYRAEIDPATSVSRSGSDQ